MEEFLTKLNELMARYPYSKTAIYSLGLFGFYYVSRFLFYSNINKRQINKADKVFYKKKVEQYLRYFFFLVLFLLWFAQLQVFFVSIFAIAAAIVLAFKELIMCITGGVLVRSSKTFSVGHRIELQKLRGYVLERNLLTTKVLEIGPESNSQQTTGDVVTIPNSLMLSQAVKNESYFKGYSIKSFHYRVKAAAHIEDLEKILLNRAIEESSSYLDEAKKSISRFCEKEGFIIPSIEPRTKVIVEDDKISVLVKLPVLNTEIANIEQNFNRLYINWLVLHEKPELEGIEK
ncbi:MAG: small-conductance mechanosensitive channel [Bacteriovoracaceae bacterium]|jgi:small-conductance mechanosensitive channel